MKYISVLTIKKALHRIYEGNTQEHRTGTAASGLLNNYFPLDRFIITPEQILESNKRPDFTIEKLKNDKFYHYAFVEIKSLINSNFNDILDQLHDTILETVDSLGGEYVIYVMAMKGSKIAFFVFHSYVGLLEEYDIMNYKGFIPLNYVIPAEKYFNINQEYYNNNNLGLIEYLKHATKLNIPGPDILRAQGVESTANIPHPHILDMLNKNHENYVHELFQHMANNEVPNDIK